MGILKDYHEVQKDRLRHYLFVILYCEATRTYPDPIQAHLVFAETTRLFLDKVESCVQTGLWHENCIDFRRHTLPLLQWFSYEKPFPVEWDTKRLSNEINYYSKKYFASIKTQKNVMIAVRKRLIGYQEFLIEQEQEEYMLYNIK